MIARRPSDTALRHDACSQAGPRQCLVLLTSKRRPLSVRSASDVLASCSTLRRPSREQRSSGRRSRRAAARNTFYCLLTLCGEKFVSLLRALGPAPLQRILSRLINASHSCYLQTTAGGARRHRHGHRRSQVSDQFSSNTATSSTLLTPHTAVGSTALRSAPDM